MATNQTSKSTTEQKIAKAPVPTVQKVTELMKRSALQGKISKDDLDVIANLAGALKTFMSA